MLDERTIRSLDEISRVLHALLNGKDVSPLTLCSEVSDEICQVAAFVNRLIAEEEGNSRFIRALSRGELDTPLEGKGRLAQVLKSFQATLRHLTWQTRQVAEGDYQQRVDFLGEYSVAFNNMVEQLQQSQEDLQRQMEELTRLATTDELTGLYNRRYFLEHAEEEYRRWKRYGAPFSLLTFDLDHFKRVNDTYGHHVGDRVLESVSEVGRDVLRDLDLFARMGGEEFAVLFRQTGLEQAQHAAERLRRKIAEHRVPTDDGPVALTMSGGLVAIGYGDDDIDAALRRADNLLYGAKERGRNRIAVER